MPKKPLNTSLTSFKHWLAESVKHWFIFYEGYGIRTVQFKREVIYMMLPSEVHDL